MTTPVLFFRGINTFADDRLHLGRVPLWKMGINLQKCVRLLNKGPERNFVMVEEIGCSTFEEEAERAEKFITRLELEQFHILAHSAGGIVAKMLLQKNAFAEKALSLTTIGTPHQGSFLAEIVDSLSFFCYDKRRKSLFDRLTPIEIKKNYGQLSLANHIKIQSVLCTSSPEKFSLPVKMVAHLFKNYKITEAGDGFVEMSSQKFGEVIGHFELDHLEELGFIFRINPRQRRSQFKQMLETINSSWIRIESMLR